MKFKNKLNSDSGSAIIEFVVLAIPLFIPVFIYYFSYNFRELIPFLYFELYLWGIYGKIVYDIFNWYNDVWIITNRGIIDLDWTLFKSNMQTIDYDNIEWMEVFQNGPIDKLLRKWDLIVHKIWDEVFALEDCYHPYKNLNIIEAVRNSLHEHDEDDSEDTKFDLIMDSLGWVVEEYLSRNMKIETPEHEKKQEHVQKYEKSKNSIDLR